MSAPAQPSIPAKFAPALPAGRRHTRAYVGVPLLLGICYGLYAAFLTSNNGASNTRIMVESFVGGAVVAVLCFAVGAVQSRLSRELRGAAYGVLFGTAMGYLLALSDETWLKAAFLGLFLGMGMGVTAFYVRYTHET
ncbi:hypothetical protein [Streptomyces sp. NPDC051776]|uniref:hypothetical protein n=1 Tax=Streptomyces sp. NPDC051776 TaxID=3155414 RepID=UPI0034354C87